MTTRTFEDAVAAIESWEERLIHIYEEEVEPGVSDNSVLEAEIDTLAGVLSILSQVELGGTSVLPVPQA